MSTQAEVNTEPKKRLIVGYQALLPELQDELKRQYPLGWTDKMIRIDKPQGDFFYAVLLETPEVNYLVKVDVKIDEDPEEEEEKGYYGDEDDDIKGAEDISDDETDEED